jgi:hypothetical protein
MEHARHARGIVSFSRKRYFNKTRILSLSSQSLARVCLDLDLRNGSGDQDTPSMFVLAEKVHHEKGKSERALYGKQECSRKNTASQCLRTIERPPRSLSCPNLRIPVIPATQSGAKLPLNPQEACHPIRTKAAPHRGTPSERSDAWGDQVTLRARRFSQTHDVYASNLLSE